MSYLVLARKYRPQDFDGLVGQLPVSQTLRNALESGRIAHAYIFSGPRGVGKTTTARILAKCLNCEKGPSITPCNACASCRSITDGSSMDDVLEIDGASNRGIEQIRELRDNVKYAPARSRYRIYIIDEAHQITKDAFGALLKTLEEPPAHVVFMMATTEVQKIPAPILSRCQRFSLRPIPSDLVLRHLKSICEKEKVKVEEEALAHIVRFVEGSLRDALSLLDQALVYSPEGVTSKTIRELLGLLPFEVVRQFATRLKEGEPAAILKAACQAADDGIDMNQMAKDLQNYYHALLLAKAGVADPLNLQAKTIEQEAKDFDYPTLERNIRLLARCLDEMRYSEAPRSIFEIYALRLGQKTLDPKTLVERLEKLESGSPRGPYSPPPPANRPSAPAASSFAKEPFRAAPASPQKSSDTEKGNRPQMSSGASGAAPAALAEPARPPAEEPSAEKPGVQTGSDPEWQERLSREWSAFIEDVAQVKQSLASALMEAVPAVQNQRLLLTFTKSFSLQFAQRSLDTLAECWARRFGAPLPIQAELGRADSVAGAAPFPNSNSVPGASVQPAANRAEPAPPSDYRKSDRPLSAIRNEGPMADLEPVSPSTMGEDVQKALKHFPGTLKKLPSS